MSQSDFNKVIERVGGLGKKDGHRVVLEVKSYLKPEELLEILAKFPGWGYKKDEEEYRLRDSALVALLYLGALRISECLRIKNDQFFLNEEKHRLEIQGIELSKRRKKDQGRKEAYRVAWLPLAYEDHRNARTTLTEIVQKYRRSLGVNDLLFPFKRKRAWQIVQRRTGLWCHYFRANGEEYLYDNWKYDMLALSSYIKVDVRTLGHYIRRGYEKHEAV